MKISYKIIKKYLPFVGTAQEVAQKLIMHTAEVEEIVSEKSAFQDMVLGQIRTLEKHPNADTLWICSVDIGEKELVQIVCGGSNLEKSQKVAVAKVGASVLWHGEWEPVIMKKTAIRGIDSYGMICASNEIGMEKEYPLSDDHEIVDLSHVDSPAGTPLHEVFGKDDEVLEIDNKAINHRPDLFSYMGILREIATIYGEKIPLEYHIFDASKCEELSAKNHIPEVVRRYSLLEVSGVENIPSPGEMETIIHAAGHSPKGFLVDISNYALYFYGQPTHCFDADKIAGSVQVRFAQDGESFIALDDKEYTLTSEDIVIADDEKILALGGVIGGKSSAVSDSTQRILIETAHFHQAIVRKTGKRLGIRTDSLNVFEKDTQPDLCGYALDFIVKNILASFSNAKIGRYFDSYEDPQKPVTQIFDLEFYNRLIGKNYDLPTAEKIFSGLWIEKKWDTLHIPFWRKELTTKADIAEEIARIDGYNQVTPTVPREQLGAIMQDTTYHLKNDAKYFFSGRWFFEVYNYSFVSESLMKKLGSSTGNLIALKNSLSEEATHMRDSLIPRLLEWLEENIRDKKSLKLFEFEKVFFKNGNNISEDYFLSGVMTSEKEIVYYDIQAIVTDFLQTVFVDKYSFEKASEKLSFAHNGRLGEVRVHGKKVGHIGEIHPSVSKRFDVEERIGFFEINISTLLDAVYTTTKAKELSSFQENRFDLCFVVDKSIQGKEIVQTIQKTDPKLIQKVELFDIYEDENKLPGKRSVSFTISIQSMTQTLGDDIKAELIGKIVEKVAKKGGVLRG